jgi:hypothetical protein
MAISDDWFLSTIRQLLLLVMDLQMQLTATHLTLEAHGRLDPAEYHQHYLALTNAPQAQALRQQMDQLSPDTILGMLRRFQGPPQ